jgi:putative ATP-dependent endonuclease of OLD family
LGYANLLFIATVVLELERASEYDLLLLLVEEPEAHLHPQLQTVLLAYLEEKARGSTNDPSAGGLPAGRIQVICTTHSPQLTNHLSPSHIVVVRAQERSPIDIPNETGGATSPTPSAPRHVETKARALSAVPLAPPDRRKIDRYPLTRRERPSSSHGRSCLWKVSLKLCSCGPWPSARSTPEAHDTQASTGSQNHQLRNQSRAITIVPIGGVDFLPFLRLLLHDGLALVDRVVVVTDGDKGAGAAGERQGF